MGGHRTRYASMVDRYSSTNSSAQLPSLTEVLVHPFREVPHRVEGVVVVHKLGCELVCAVRRRDEHQSRPVLLPLQLFDQARLLILYPSEVERIDSYCRKPGMQELKLPTVVR